MVKSFYYYFYISIYVSYRALVRYCRILIFLDCFYCYPLLNELRIKPRVRKYQRRGYEKAVITEVLKSIAVIFLKIRCVLKELSVGSNYPSLSLPLLSTFLSVISTFSAYNFHSSVFHNIPLGLVHVILHLLAFFIFSFVCNCYRLYFSTSHLLPLASIFCNVQSFFPQLKTYQKRTSHVLKFFKFLFAARVSSQWSHVHSGNVCNI